MSIGFFNYSMSGEIKYEQPWYDWCVFATGDKETIDRVISVRYRLHPSFPNPTRISYDKLHRFPLVTNGWGEFSIGIDVEFIDGKKESTSHWLRLRDDEWPRKSPSTFETDEHGAVYRVLAEGTYRWRKLQTLVSKTDLTEIAVRSILRDLETDDLVRPALVRSIDGHEMWGATSLVGVLPHL